LDGGTRYKVRPGSSAICGGGGKHDRGGSSWPGLFPQVAAWRITGDGHLAKLGEYAGLPQTISGDSAPSDFSPLGSPAGIDVL